MTMAGTVVNAMSIDVEDYFHVSVFDGIVPRTRWTAMESRVVRNTERLLDIFAEYRVRSTFFILGWVAEELPEPALRRLVAEAGPAYAVLLRLVRPLWTRAERRTFRYA